MPRYINDDATVKQNGRKAMAISIEQLANLMLKRAKQIADICKGYDIPAKGDMLHSVRLQREVLDVLYHNDEHIRNDNKYSVDGENLLLSNRRNPSDSDLMGFRRLPNNIPVFGFKAGGDWETPVFMIIYFDGKNLRSYTPARGNCVNCDCKCAFGSESEAEYDEAKLRSKYKKKRVLRLDSDGKLTEMDLMYMALYGLTPKSLSFHWSGILEEICERLQYVPAVENPQLTPVKKKRDDEKERQEYYVKFAFAQMAGEMKSSPGAKVVLRLTLKNGENLYVQNVNNTELAFVTDPGTETEKMIREAVAMLGYDNDVLIRFIAPHVHDYGISVKPFF